MPDTSNDAEKTRQRVEDHAKATEARLKREAQQLSADTGGKHKTFHALDNLELPGEAGTAEPFSLGGRGFAPLAPEPHSLNIGLRGPFG